LSSVRTGGRREQSKLKIGKIVFNYGSVETPLPPSLSKNFINEFQVILNDILNKESEVRSQESELISLLV
jgi:hypothetical protein